MSRKSVSRVKLSKAQKSDIQSLKRLARNWSEFFNNKNNHSKYGFNAFNAARGFKILDKKISALEQKVLNNDS